MKRKTFNDPDMMVGVLRRRRPVLTAWLLFWCTLGVWCAIVAIFVPGLIYAALCCVAMAGVYLLRIVRVKKRLEELE